MTLRVAIQMNPISGVNSETDTSFLMAHNAQERGHKTWVYAPEALALEDGTLTARAQSITVRAKVGDHVTLGPVALDPYAGGRVVMPSELTNRALSTGLMPNVANKLDALMAPVSDRQVLIRLQNVIFARAVQSLNFERAERSALRRALLSPQDHHPWLDVAAAREGQGRLSGALEALGRAQALGGSPVTTRLAGDRVRRQLN